MKGRIVKLVSNDYTVLGDDGSRSLCKARGIFKFKDQSLKVGDIVEFENSNIIKLYERKNTFIRPFISNVDYVILVMSSKRPDIDFELLDRFIINITEEDVEPIIVITKCDLLNSEEFEHIKEILSYYEKYYKVFYSKKEGLYKRDEFNELLKNKISVVSGQTGAGKSHLLNTLSSSLSLRTQDISDALGRGKHTTRVTELLKVDDMFIADTPGFSSLELVYIKSTDLKEYYPEFVENLNKCRFNQCMHIHEPECYIKKLVDDGSIIKCRYDSYLKFMTELKENEKTYRKEK